jgi:hypothetical protein
MRYTGVLTSEGNSTIVIYDDDLNSTTVTDDHPNFLRIVSGLQAGEDVTEWLDPMASHVFLGLSGKVSVTDDGLFYDGKQVHSGLADTILRYRREGRDVFNLVRFMERLVQNPSPNSVEQLFTWTQAKELVIDNDGFIIAYKGVRGDKTSVHSGTAFVDGQEHTGHIPNEVNTVISMPRDKVNPNPNQGCSYGLHVGNWDYASSFGSVLLEVRVDPADVVSVPADCSYQKMRTCRYEVIAVHESDTDDVSDIYEPMATWDEDDTLDGFDTFMESAPPTFMQRLRNRFKGLSGE